VPALNFIENGPSDAATTVLLAHGAGAAMDSASMDMAAKALATEGLRVVRFEFAYMAARREGQRRPPPKAETLIGEYVAAVEALGETARLVIGGKSMGGRVASMVADRLKGEGKVAGLVCLGYPFHPPGKPLQLRTAHLAGLATPTLIMQGTRDEFGTRPEVQGYALSPAIEVLWLEDGDHDLKPRKSVSGFSHADHMAAMAKAVAVWSEGLAAA
jgi:predicted alpha/beta-hydrolase family hydrolase